MKSFSDSTSGTFAKFVFKLHSYVRTIGSSRLPTIQNKKLNIQNLRTIPLTPSPLNPLIPRRLPAAFSLTEVVIAMGVAAVAFTSIIALFPLGLNMSKESYEATQAALIAQAIMADLSDQTSTSGGKLIQKTGSNDLVAANYETISMSGSSSTRNIYLAYAQDVRADSSNSPIMLRPTNSSLTLPDWYTKGTNGSVLLVKVTMDKTFHFAGSGTAPSRTGGYPQKVDVSVESPASAPATNRTQHLFSGVIPYK
ncbi:MAG: hypothetical protein QM531_03820 [Candidatus Pacebacteria bacterium]|nr:hypothetical protein [Candidatus Paceibacterota bacterium]